MFPVLGLSASLQRCSLSTVYNITKRAMVTLPPTITPGVLNLAGTTPDSQQVAERLLAMDRETHHCFYGKVGFHNHLSHQ